MNTKTGYKLFEMRDDNRLYPLFISKNQEIPMNNWVAAEIVMEHKGFAHRPGYHVSAHLPSAPWLMSADGTYKSQRGKRFTRVWCEVEYAANIDYTEEVQKLPKKCFTDRLPSGGFYNFKESGDRLWVITDRIKITRIIGENERMNIFKNMNYDEAAAFAPYRIAMAKRMHSASSKTPLTTQN